MVARDRCTHTSAHGAAPRAGPPRLAALVDGLRRRQGALYPPRLAASAGGGAWEAVQVIARLYRAHFPADWQQEPLRARFPSPRLLVRLTRSFLDRVDRAGLLPIWDSCWLDEDEAADLDEGEGEGEQVRFTQFIPVANPGWYFPLPLEDGEDELAGLLPGAALALLALLAGGGGLDLREDLGLPEGAWEEAGEAFVNALPAPTRELYGRVAAACAARGAAARAWEARYGWRATGGLTSVPFPPRPSNVWSALSTDAAGVGAEGSAVADLPLLARYMARDTGNAFLDFDAEAWEASDAGTLVWSVEEFSGLLATWGEAQGLERRIRAQTDALARPAVFHAALVAVEETCRAVLDGPADGAGASGRHAPGHQMDHAQ